ncbi:MULTISPECIES: hypothetical protein [unclassified Methylobacterium]|uniref:hypothetical protein n=1 Tax=unclassified Methylobacterium TaxID=2615210 RepID=UPI0031452DFA
MARAALVGRERVPRPDRAAGLARALAAAACGAVPALRRAVRCGDPAVRAARAVRSRVVPGDVAPKGRAGPAAASAVVRPSGAHRGPTPLQASAVRASPARGASAAIAMPQGRTRAHGGLLGITAAAPVPGTAVPFVVR